MEAFARIGLVFQGAVGLQPTVPPSSVAEHPHIERSHCSHLQNAIVAHTADLHGCTAILLPIVTSTGADLLYLATAELELLSTDAWHLGSELCPMHKYSLPTYFYLGQVSPVRLASCRQEGCLMSCRHALYCTIVQTLQVMQTRFVLYHCTNIARCYGCGGPLWLSMSSTC